LCNNIFNWQLFFYFAQQIMQLELVFLTVSIWQNSMILKNFTYEVSLFLQLILDRIFKGINEKVTKGSWLKRALFDFAYQYKLKWSKRGFETPLLNK
jgi:hypothetical protein